MLSFGRPIHLYSSPRLAAFNTSVLVANPTDVKVTVTAPAQGTGETANACHVTITGGETVPARRTSTVSITVTPVPTACPDPADGGHKVVLLESDGTTTVELAIKKNAAPPEDPKATGIIWPTDPVFLHRRHGTLTGSFTVVNPTNAVIKVKAPTLKDSCEQLLPDPDAKTVEVQPHGEAPIPVLGPTNCADLSSTTIVATAAAEAPDGSKSDVAKLTLQAEVDWGRFGWFLVISLVAGLALSLCAARVVSKVRFREPLRIDSTSPTSWLTSIAAIGPLLTALASTTGLPKGLFGSDALPQQTLILGAAAIALLLVGVAGLVTGIPLARAVVEGKPQTCPRAWQFAVGAGLSAAAAALEIWAVTTALSRLDLPILGSGITIGQIVALTAATVYLWVSVRHYVKTYGIQPPAASPTPSNELVATLTELFVELPLTSETAAKDAVKKANRVADELVKELSLVAPQPSAPARPPSTPGFSRNLI